MTNIPQHPERILLILLLVFSHLTRLSADSFQRVADLNPGSVGSFPSNLTVYAESALFAAYTQAIGSELWRYNGTNIALVRDINETADDIGFGVLEGNDSFPAWLTHYKNKLYFSAFDPRRGAELWQYDGLSATRAADINPDNDDTIKLSPKSSWPRELTVFNNNLYFTANGGPVSTNYELWKYDGTVATQAADLHPPSGTNHSSFPTGFKVFNNGLYFMADDGTNGYELWKHDGSSTILLTNINPGGPGSSSYPKLFTEFEGVLYFQAFHPSYGYELWQTDGVTVSLAADLNPGAASSYPEYFTVYNNQLYFRATGPTEGSELWVLSENTPVLVQDINPFGDAYPKNLTTHNGSLFFSADDGVNGWELWQFDGETASMVSDVHPWGDSYPESFAVFNGALYFVATAPDTGYEVYRYDGENVTVAADINPGAASSYPQFLTAFENELLLRAAEDGWNDWELWALTSEPAGFTVSLTSPTSNSTFFTTDTISFAVVITGTADIARVVFLMDGQLIGSDETAPYTFDAALPAGTHSITARAFDSLDAGATSSPIIVTVTAPNAPPTVTLTAPEEGANVLASEPIAFSADASDDGNVAQVDFYAETQLLGTSFSAPYTVTSTLPAGSYSITAIATDDLGLSTTSSAVAITVTAPNEPPSVVLTAPADGATFTSTETITFTADTSDDGGVAQVEFYAGTELLGTDSSEPYTVTSRLSAGSYSITAVAIDDLGVNTTSSAVAIMVTGPNEPPSVVLTAPPEGATFPYNESIIFTADASDDLGVDHVEFVANDEVIGTDTAAPYSLTVTLLPGSYIITAKATDSTGLESTSTAVSITVESSGTGPDIQSAAMESAAFVIVANATSGLDHVLEASADLQTWTPILTNAPTAGVVTFRDEDMQDSRFYRIVIP